MKPIPIEITKTGGIRMLWDDRFDIRAFGKPKVKRVSHIEFNNTTGDWVVKSAKTGKQLHKGFVTREAALDWEHKYYSPKGKGWKEIVR
jgi:hypothetical protein